MDGRADLYGDDLLRQFKDAIQLHTGWSEILNNWEVQTVLIPPTSALAQALTLDPRWMTEFSDAQSIVLTRVRSSSNTAAILKEPR